MRKLGHDVGSAQAQGQADPQVGGTPGKRTLAEAAPRHPMAAAQGLDASGGSGPAPVPYRSKFLPPAGGGSALPAPQRARFEQSLGADLGGVRVHTGSASKDSAAAMGAQAYALGSDIHFGQGQFNPGTEEGDRLLAHEVAHTVQAGGATATDTESLEVSEPGDAAEVQADSAAEAMVKGEPAQVGASSAGVAPKLYRNVAPSASVPAAAPANFQQNEKVDTKKIATLITNVSSLSERIGDCASTTGDECQTLLTSLTAGGTNSVVGGMNKLADTFASAAVNFEKELAAALKANTSPVKAKVQEMLEKQIGKAIGNQLKPMQDALGKIEVIKKDVDAVFGKLKSLGSTFAVELLMPADPAGPATPTVNAHLKKVENYDKVITLVGEVGRVSGRSGSLSGACLKVVPKLIQNLDALLLGSSTTDGTVKSPSDCESAYQGLLPAKAACDSIKKDVAALKVKINGMKSTAALQADTEVMSAERQLWSQYYEMNPDEPWYGPACFGKDSRPLVHTIKLDMVKMVGKTGECTASINTDGAKNPLLPNAPAMSSPGKIKLNNQTYRASAPNGKRIPIGTECRIVDAKVGATSYGSVDEHEWELIVDADVPFENTTPDSPAAPTPAQPGTNFSPNEKADPKKMASLIDTVTASSEKIGNTAENASTKTTAMMDKLVSQSPAQGALGAFIQVGRVFDSAFEGFEAKIKAHDKAKADAHAIAEKIVSYAVGRAIGYVADPLKGVYTGAKLISDKIESIVEDLESMAHDYAVKLIVGPPPEPTPIIATPRLNQLADIEKLLSLATDVGKLSARSSKISGATLRVIPKLINNLSALMHHSATADGTVKSPSEVEALANKVAALRAECDAIDKALATMQAKVDDMAITAVNQAKVIDKPSAERQLWTKFCQDHPGAELELDMTSAFGGQPRPGLWANQMEMVKLIGKQGTVSETINGGPAAPLVPGSSSLVPVMSPGKVKMDNRPPFKASSTDGKPLTVGTPVRVIDAKTGMTQHGTEMQENDWELIVQPVTA